MVMVPLGGDQPDNAQRMASRGAGVVLDITTVTVDVTFHPSAATAMAISTSTHINSRVTNTPTAAGPLFNFPLANSQESDQSASRMPHCK
jgi:hypothetical protein